MVEFKDVLKRRITLLIAFSVISILLIAIIGTWGYGKIGIGTHMEDFMHGAQAGLSAGFLAVMLKYILKYYRAIKSEDKIKSIYIEENDEREELIKNKIGGVGFFFIMGVIMVSIIISGFFNEIVFLTLLGVLVFMIFVKIFLKIYYNRKF